jgi:hypothetical protein
VGPDLAIAQEHVEAARCPKHALVHPAARIDRSFRASWRGSRASLWFHLGHDRCCRDRAGGQAEPSVGQM